MVSVTHALPKDDAPPPIDTLAEGLSAGERALIEKAVTLALDLYEDRLLGSGEPVWPHALGMSLICASLRLDAETRIAALLFAACDYLDDGVDTLVRDFGGPVAQLVDGLRKLNGLRVITRMTATASAPEIRTQAEVLRKMLLAMVQDIRVVLLRLASRTQTLRYYTDEPDDARLDVARESLDIYAPLANRLGVWQLKWELEDLSFRFLEPDTYKRIAKMLDERRVEREGFIDKAIERLRNEIAAVGIQAEVYGRPKHIYSIYNKMRKKHLDFSEVYDIRALRVLVDEVRDCYTVLGIVHQIWQPISKEYDDYISKPKGNNYQSLHTAVLAGDGRAVEVQIRTHEMHRHAELGVAAHWRYKEGAKHGGDYDEKIALLRSLLSWRDEVADSADWVERFKRASLDDTLYVLTPQGRVVDLPRGATPVDFAYRVHTDLGHRCRGAKVDGHLVPLNTALDNGQTVEITAAKEGGPSRDWLDPRQGYVATSRARNKIKQYFSQQEEEDLLARGRSFVTREMQRDGHAQANIEGLAGKLGFKNADAMFVAAGRGEVGPRAVQVALREAEAAPEAPAEPEIVVGRSRSGDTSDKVLIVGVGKLLTSLSRCCKPAPPDAIEGFVTRGRGISIHRVDCHDFQQLAKQHPERVIEAEWGDQAYNNRQALFPVDIAVQAIDRQGLLRDISEVLSREKLNVTAVNTLTKKGTAHMRFTMEVGGVTQMQRAITLIREVSGVIDAQRR
ncbi:bifunctional (p)ppGpp synthetase/guanosine-3',5'-bis(diphosphate) 3'-pyrophosphohydrolase [Thauera sp. CAU 1555]|uniref:GTP pyrophosphokinase n=1 Tax=Thauera sedimentorum TaxID=2767595 RepID=A0ABR9BAL6_9RHOO|nr:bifunctional (p)ppGpp synthetase/guanosine-3',5'-bis(diphosphate) 3'-pyrophosphohydrolase [Thauera sedimentorum]MBC9071601.1 bifunctional (p)ppGpp synthetase/guanosine-3',5'-bis(diphosphate) 3'-pyrophosphohydrolase [Thauera sedimentorum]MBD8502520.1 bifunctional (p)ppGpp synthetase/guanosine-3',5'-bis(diphosphate) 3'-pyrophosphohydrolase [Thauera sedimentorum]